MSDLLGAPLGPRLRQPPPILLVIGVLDIFLGMAPNELAAKQPRDRGRPSSRNSAMKADDDLGIVIGTLDFVIFARYDTARRARCGYAQAAMGGKVLDFFTAVIDGPTRPPEAWIGLSFNTDKKALTTLATGSGMR